MDFKEIKAILKPFVMWFKDFTNIEDLSPLWISLRTAVLASILTLILGVLIAWIVETKLKRSKGLIDAILTLPMILPPTVVGFCLLYTLGRQGIFGDFLDAHDMSIVFTWQATVIAAAVVSFPLMYKGARGGFEQIDENVLDAARLLGASEARVMLRCAIPMALPGIAAGFVLSFARALGEFGATLMIAGNIPGKTQTIPMAIYFFAEGGELEKAYAWVAIIFIISFIFMFLINHWNDSQKKAKIKMIKEEGN